MCGICGTTMAGDGRSLRAMNDAMIHRGPDDEGIHVDPQAGVGLGARRLSVIDVAGGHQPLCDQSKQVWAVLNGEIYNHVALREQLRARGYRFRTRSDTEVLVHLYAEYGDDLVHALEGMYAFAIWDQQRGRLLIARDRFGEKPLFYVEARGDLTFASELTALGRGVGAAWELRPESVDAFFVLGYVPGPDTIFDGPCQLAPGHVLTWEASTRSAVVRRYWALPSPPQRLAPGTVVEELIDETSRLLERSVRARMVADVPIGVLLSGGVDSTLVAVLAARSSSAPVHTFTVGYDVGEVSEADSARRAAAAIGTRHHEVTLSIGDVASAAPTVLAALDQPIADRALVAMHAVTGFARRSVTVAVGGEGADELFGGYPRYRWLSHAARLHRMLPQPLLKLMAEIAAGSPLGARVPHLDHLLRPATPLDRQVAWVTGGRPGLRRELSGPRLGPALRPTRDLHGRATTSGLSAVEAAPMRLDQSVWLPDDVLAKADRASMLVSLELRTPFLDRSLAELSASVPASVHGRGGGKLLLRSVLHRLLPAHDSPRKVAFRVPAAEWLRGPLRPVLEQVIARGALCDEGWFDRPALQRLEHEHVAGVCDHTEALWPVLALGVWLDRLRGCHGR